MAVVKVWGRGQLTIPASLRKELLLDEETVLHVVKVGDALLLTPKKLVGDALAKKAEKEMEKAGLSLKPMTFHPHLLPAGEKATSPFTSSCIFP